MIIYNSLTNNNLTVKEIRLFNEIYKYPDYTLLYEELQYTKANVTDLNEKQNITEVIKDIRWINMISLLLQQTYDPTNVFYNPFRSDYSKTLFKEDTPNKNVRIIIAYAKKICDNYKPSSSGGGIKKFTKKRNNKKYKLSKHKNINKLKTRSFHKTNNNNNNNNKNNKKTKHKN